MAMYFPLLSYHFDTSNWILNVGFPKSMVEIALNSTDNQIFRTKCGVYISNVEVQELVR